MSGRPTSDAVIPGRGAISVGNPRTVLPSGWQWTALASIAELGTGHTPSRKHPEYWGGDVPWIGIRDAGAHHGNVINDTFQHINQLGLENSSARLLPKDTVCLSRTASVGYVVKMGRAMATSQDFVTWSCTEALDPDFLMQALIAEGTDIRRFGEGSTHTTIYFPELKAFHVALPPAAEQRRIVANIHSLTGKSRRARDHLDHIPRLMEKFKQSVLAAAFRGGLVGHSTASTDLPHKRCWDLPGSWRWVLFSDVVEIASNLVRPDEIPELPHIAPDNVEGGTGRLLPFRTIREDGVISPKHRFFSGQVIYSKIRPYLRKAVLVDFDGACSADMYPLTTTAQLDPAYLLYWLISEQFASFAFEHEGRSVLPKINQQGLNQTPLPLPPLTDQHETVRRLQAAFNWIDRLDVEATSARKLIDHLNQAVLAKAFRGELVPQDPTDEPASVLLERIKAERAEAGTLRIRRARRA